MQNRNYSFFYPIGKNWLGIAWVKLVTVENAPVRRYSLDGTARKCYFCTVALLNK